MQQKSPDTKPSCAAYHFSAVLRPGAQVRGLHGGHLGHCCCLLTMETKDQDTIAFLLCTYFPVARRYGGYMVGSRIRINKNVDCDLNA